MNDGRFKSGLETESKLFRRLTRLFSGPIVNRRAQGVRRWRKKQLDMHKFRSLSGTEFKKNARKFYQGQLSESIKNQNRVDRYADFDQMEYDPIIFSALDLYAEEITTSTEMRPLLKINCRNEEIKSILRTLYYDILNVEYNLFGWVRTCCKYGDLFVYLDTEPGFGIRAFVGLPPNEIERMEGQDESNPYYVQFQWNEKGATFENCQIAHFRILGNDKYAPYGTSVLDGSRRIWRQVTLVKDLIMAYRAVRSSERRAYYIDVGNTNPNDIEALMQKTANQLKTAELVDHETGQVDYRYNPASIEHDIFIPVFGQNSATRIETLPGGKYTGDIDDLKLLQSELFAALKIPQSYLMRGEGGEEDKTTLSQKDSRFARTIQRLQRTFITELEKIGIIHLAAQGIENEGDLTCFTLSLNNPSRISELQELEDWKQRIELGNMAKEGKYFSRSWIGKTIFGLSDEEIIRNQKEIYTDSKFEAEIDSILQGGVEGEGGELGDIGEIGGEDTELEGEDFEFNEENNADIEASNELEKPEDSILLAAPARRNYNFKNTDSKSTKSRSKIKKTNDHGYRPTTSDRRGAGARTRHYSTFAKPEYGTTRKNYPGVSDIMSLSKGIVNESNVYSITNYNSNKNEKQIDDLKERIESTKDYVKKLQNKLSNAINGNIKNET